MVATQVLVWTREIPTRTPSDNIHIPPPDQPKRGHFNFAERGHYGFGLTSNVTT